MSLIKPHIPSIQQAGVIPYIIKDDIIKYVLVTSRNHRHRWILPKGMLEPNIPPWKSAMKEGFEEAGVYGEISTQVCAHYQYEKRHRICHVDMYLLRVIDLATHWEEDFLRCRRICPYDEACQLIFKRVKPVLFAAQQQLTAQFD